MGAPLRLNTVELGSKTMPADQFSCRAAGCTVFKSIQDIDLNCQVAMHYLEQITRLMGHSLMPLVNQTHYDFILPGTCTRLRAILNRIISMLVWLSKE